MIFQKEMLNLSTLNILIALVDPRGVLSYLCSFRLKNRIAPPTLRVGAPIRKILDPPLDLSPVFPSTNKVCKGCVFIHVCLFTVGAAYVAGGMHGRGHTWQGGMHGGGMQGGMCGGVHGRGHVWQGQVWKGVCMAGGHVWQGGMHRRGACMVGACVGGGVHDRGACVAWGHAWQGGVHGGGHDCLSPHHTCPPTHRYYEIRSMKGWYASYWNAFL